MLSDDAVDIHSLHIDQGYRLFHENDFESALVEFDQAIAIDNTRPMAHWDRALTLLALGRYAEGFRGWRYNWQLYNAEITPRAKDLYFDQHKPLWRGERDARVVILGEAGYGDQIQMLRFVPQAAQIADVALEMPWPLRFLARQIGKLENFDDDKIDFVCPMFDLPAIFEATPFTIPPPPYLMPNPILRDLWARRIGNGGRRRIGIAWSTKFEETAEHPNARRAIPLDQFVELLGETDCELYSLQTQDREQADARGIHTAQFSDFADVAALAACMDRVVCIDTAALHIAGAIGHPDAIGLLPYSPTWRWLNPCWYPSLRQCRQQAPGDWASAFAQIGEREDGQRDQAS